MLILDYMISTGQVTPELEMKAQEYINLGYQRLLTFECANGGFDWYGGEGEGEPILTSYGLMEFADMSNVHYVDPDMINRTQQWLAGKQEADASWPPDDYDLFNRMNNTLQSTAYAIWSLVHSGFPVNDAHVTNGKNYLKNNITDNTDNYTLALCANALLEKTPADPTGLSILDQLDAKKIEEADTVHWESTGNSFTYSRGDYLNLETTALITYALMSANWRYPNSIEGAIKYIVQKKEPQGLWGQTQASVLSLKVLMKALTRQALQTEGEITININGQTLDKSIIPILEITLVDSGILRLIDLKHYTIEGDNSISVNLSGGANLMYQIVGTYFLPWSVITPPPEPQLQIDLIYDRTTLSVDDIIVCSVTVTNTLEGTVTRIGMLDLGVPPGFALFWEDFEQAIAEGKIFKYESTNRQLTLYLYPISNEEPLTITYRLQAKYPLRVSTPVSSAYEYYNPTNKDKTTPVILTVN